VRSALCLLQSAVLFMAVAAQLDAHFISGNAGVVSAQMILSGAQTLSVTSGSQGNYSFRGLPSGTYVLTPSLHGYSFTPSSRSITIASANVGSVNFTATVVRETSLLASPASMTFTASGATEQLAVEATYSDESSQNVTPNAIYASNNTSVATVSQNGLITAMGSGSATVIASYGGFASSVSITVKIPSATYSISGTAGVASATVSISGAANASATANSSGAFSFSNLVPGSYTITPSLSGYSFTPTSQSKTITNANLSGVNFTAAATSHSVELTWGAGSILNPAPGQVVVGYNVYRASVSGGPYTKLNTSAIPGLTYTDTAVAAGQTWYYVCATVDNLGNVSTDSSQATAVIP